jgi:hypothetical protein
MSAPKHFIRMAIVDTLCKEDSVVTVVNSRGAEVQLTSDRAEALTIAEKFRLEGYHETIITGSLSVFTNVNRKGKVHL